MKILHISDLHYHRDPDKNSAADLLLATIQEKFPEHYLVVTGDVTDDGHIEQYENAFRALEPFKGRVFLVPGNHDFGAAGNFYSTQKAERFDDILSIPLEQHGFFAGDNIPVINVTDGIEFIALDSNLETNTPFDFACGEIGNRQLTELDKILNRSHGKIKVVCFHHHPFVFSDPFMELKDARELARVIYNRVDVMLFGHKHEMDHWQNRWGTTHILASDNSPDKSLVGEIAIDDDTIEMNYVEV